MRKVLAALLVAVAAWPDEAAPAECRNGAEPFDDQSGSAIDGSPAVPSVGRLDGFIRGLGQTESAYVHVWRLGGVGDHVHSPAWRGGAGKHVGSTVARVGDGHFELNGIPDGTYVVEADSGDTSLKRKVRFACGRGSVHFDFTTGGTSLTGRVLAGERPLSGVRLELVPVDIELPFVESSTDEEGGYAVDGLGHGDYQIVVKLGHRGTWRSFHVTLTGETVFDVPLGPFSLSGNVLDRRRPRPADGVARKQGPFGLVPFENHVMQARLLDPSDEPIVFRDFVNSRGMYSFDGLGEGNYAVSHVSPYYESVREVTVSGESLEGVDIEPIHSETRPVRVADAVSGIELQSAHCKLVDGTWAGTFVLLGRGRELPLTLADTDMTCSSPGYEPVRFRWDGKPLQLDLERGSAEDGPWQMVPRSVMHEIFTP